MITISPKMHTLLLLIGPSGCGKTHFSKNVLIPQLQQKLRESNLEEKTFYVSSDDCRREMLPIKEDGYHTHDSKMMQVSSSAFKLLYSKIEALMMYPTNAYFIVVDTTGLSERFRTDMVNMANKYKYNIDAIVFDYNSREEYIKYLDQGYQPDVVGRHLSRFKEKVLKHITKKDFNNIWRIKTKESTDYEVSLFNNKEYKSHILTGESSKYAIVGDIHGCYDEFIELLHKLGCEIDFNNKIVKKSFDKIILIGDIIDKGPKTPELIDFIHSNIDHFLLVKGNHENYVYKAATGKIDKKNNLEEEYFDTAEILRKNESLFNKFISILSFMKEFYVHENFIVTHAPCYNDVLSKMDQKSLKFQRNNRYPRRKDFENDYDYDRALDDKFSYLQNDGNFAHPIHVFGHVAMEGVSRFKNNICIDTGCAYGNKLSAIVIDSGRYTPYEVKSKQPVSEGIIRLFKTNDRFVDLDKIDYFIKRRLNKIVENKVTYISGTMSPADKDGDVLESMKWALEYYKKAGLKEVILQPKHMGSRCNLYLNIDCDKSYAVSRNGYVITPRTVNDIEYNLSDVFQKMHDNFKSYMEANNVEIMIFDGELMPWIYMADGMIEKNFRCISRYITNEINLLKELDFDKHKEILDNKISESEFSKEHGIQKKELVTKYGNSIYETYTQFSQIKNTLLDLDEQSKALELFNKQIELYGAKNSIDKGPWFQAFSLLKTVHSNCQDKTYFSEKNSEMYKFVTNDKGDYVVIKLDNIEFAIDICTKYMKELSDNGLEGVVVKPEDSVYIKGVAPYLKVRNENYLRIVYGYDYLENKSKYNKLLNKKRVTRKLRMSMEEFELGKRILDIPYHKIDNDNEQFKKIVVQLLSEIAEEKTLDPRL